ncbi:MAG: hypothetical protein FH748_00755 [Balneolaceae bacterium]|nr:hypothetical protein [Balneolaceae bacterium]
MDFNKILSKSTKKPQSILKIVLSLSAAVLVIWLFLVSRMELNSTSQTQDPEITQRTEGLRNSLLKRDAEKNAEKMPRIHPKEDNTVVEQSSQKGNEIALAQTENEPENERAQEPPQKAETKSEESDVFGNAVTTFFVMLTLLGGIWIWAKRKEKAPHTKGGLRELGGHVLGQGAQLKFVEINNEVWVLSITSDSVNLLQQIPRDEWTETQAIQQVDGEASDTSDFKSLYKFFKN